MTATAAKYPPHHSSNSLTNRKDSPPMTNTRMTNRRRIFGAIAAAAAAMMLATGCQAPGPADQDTAPPVAPPAATLPAVPGPSLASRLYRWYNAGPDTALAQLVTDMRGIMREANAGVAPERACRDLALDAANFWEWLPTPDPTLTAKLKTTMNAEADAARFCLSGRYGAAAAALATANAAMDQGTQRINDIAAGLE